MKIFGSEIEIDENRWYLIEGGGKFEVHPLTCDRRHGEKCYENMDGALDKNLVCPCGDYKQ